MTDRMPWEEASQYVNPLSLIEAQPTCEADGCSKPARTKLLCDMHYMRLWRSRRPKPQKATHIERFSKFVDTSAGQDACHIWTGHLRNEYPSFRVGKSMVTATRWILGVVVGRELVPGEEACHHCDNPICVNPKHLYVGTHSDNMADAVRRGRAVNLRAEERKAQTHCIHGHEFNDVNTYFRKEDGGRVCRPCRREWKQQAKLARARAGEAA